MSHSAPAANEHPFAPYVRILGKGPNLSRPLTLDEARAAMGMIMAGEVLDAQLGAFLCLLRVKTELPEEAAGLALGIKDALAKPAGAVKVDVDWASYAGKSRQLPYYVLAALTLAQHGIKVFMHGAEGHTAGRVYTSDALAALGVPVATSTAQAVAQLQSSNFAYMTLEHLSPALHKIMGLKAILGLRSPIHTVARMVNPFDAAFSVNAVTHPPYMPVHQEGARLMGEQAMAVFKGDGGEVERRPEKSCEVCFLEGGKPGSEEWPAIVAGVRDKEDSLDLARLKRLWSGEDADETAAAVIAGTIAIVLRYSGRAKSVAEAEGAGQVLWRDRIKGKVL
ncbi:glycosyl transferase family protein [Magnetospirillum sp. UT-4]|uniref:glycosyl transferase family protein n=1 Tax=Magnetospirillum sp. UT-4 TaxID=2681467 RepID=UPI001385F07F|nr:glycosyl transferase family protein [Magnetospirillum sp. UT-4]CAA7626245.1 putative phosphoribosyltransferase [Magnetospirillum sp. UT-4]